MVMPMIRGFLVDWFLVFTLIYILTRGGTPILRPGYTASDELARELIAYCQEHMAAYKRPRWVEFVAELPKTGTGKTQRFKLRQQA